jgi:hypothetical protein
MADWFRPFYNESWFGDEWKMNEKAGGYQAPPLDGIWATAPYFHNGSVPTVYAVLNPDARPKYFRRRDSTGLDAYDPMRLGWKVEELPHGQTDGPVTSATPQLRDPARQAAAATFERRKIFDTTLPGKSNAGHPFGQPLSDSERRAVIEYLKTL